MGQPQQAAKAAAGGATPAMLLAQDAPASMPQPRLAGSRKRADSEEGVYGIVFLYSWYFLHYSGSSELVLVVPGILLCVPMA